MLTEKLIATVTKKIVKSAGGKINFTTIKNNDTVYAKIFKKKGILLCNVTVAAPRRPGGIRICREESPQDLIDIINHHGVSKIVSISKL